MAQNTWKEKLQEVRSFVKETEKVESVVEETPVVSEGTDVENEIEELLKEEFAEDSKTEETLESLQEERLRLQEELKEVDNRIKELDNGSVEKSVEKLADAQVESNKIQEQRARSFEKWVDFQQQQASSQFQSRNRK